MPGLFMRTLAQPLQHVTSLNRNCCPSTHPLLKRLLLVLAGLKSSALHASCMQLSLRTKGHAIHAIHNCP